MHALTGNTEQWDQWTIRHHSVCGQHFFLYYHPSSLKEHFPISHFPWISTGYVYFHITKTNVLFEFSLFLRMENKTSGLECFTKGDNDFIVIVGHESNSNELSQ